MGLEAGLGLSSDPAGNLFLRLAGAADDAAPVLTGSYLDSQPDGGRYSGAYGLVAALEALAAIAATGAKPRRPIVAAAWMTVGIAPRGAVLAEDIRDLQSWAGHAVTLVCRALAVTVPAGRAGS